MSTWIAHPAIDYRVSGTYARGYAEYYGWSAPQQCESLREARFRESLEVIHQGETQIKGGEKEHYAELRRRIEQIEAENAYLRAKVSERRAEQSPAAQMLKDLKEMG